MARRVRAAFKKVPPDVYEGLRKTKRLTSSGALKRLKKMGLKPVTSVSEIRRMVKSESGKHNIPITVSEDMMGCRYAEGTTGVGNKDNRVVIHIHPVEQYYHKQHIRDIIGHELDHAGVMRKQKQGI